MLILEAIDTMQCPNCQQKRLAEYSAITPIVVKCRECGATFEWAYVRGYWHGYQKSKQENGNGKNTSSNLSSL